MTTGAPEDAPQRRSSAERSSKRANSDAQRSRSAPRCRKCSPVMKSITFSFWANIEIVADNPRLIQLALRTASLSEIFAMERITATAVGVAQRHLSSAAATGRTPGCRPLQRRVRRLTQMDHYRVVLTVEQSLNVGNPSAEKAAVAVHEPSVSTVDHLHLCV